MGLNKFHNLDIILIAGLYGSGKNHLVKKYFKQHNRVRVSRLEIRRSLFEMANYGKLWNYKDFNEEDDILVKHVERKVVEHNMQKKNKILVINTFVSAKSRNRFIKLAKDNGKTIGIIFLIIPLDTCIEQNVNKIDIVPEQVIRVLNQKKEVPTKKEGYSEVMVLTKYEKTD